MSQKINSLGEPTRRHHGSIITKSNSRNLYLLFHYFKERVEYSTGDADTLENRVKWESWLDRNMKRIEDGTFVYEKAFPHAKRQKKEFFGRLESRGYQTHPSEITFGEYANWYIDEVLPNFASISTIKDYHSALRPMSLVILVR